MWIIWKAIILDSEAKHECRIDGACMWDRGLEAKFISPHRKKEKKCLSLSVRKSSLSKISSMEWRHWWFVIIFLEHNCLALYRPVVLKDLTIDAAGRKQSRAVKCRLKMVSHLSVHVQLCKRFTWYSLIPNYPNYRSFDFFNSNFDHLSYSKKLCKHS